MIGGTHGDELEGVILAKGLRDWLIENHTHITRPWILIPNINPDGIAASTRTNANGVDLNRNYPDSRWSADFSEPQFNPGSAPCSEPEIAALVSLINTYKPELMIHFHSYDPCIVCTGKPGLSTAKTLADCSGYHIQPDIGYPSPGSLGEWGWLDLGIPVICIEEQKGIEPETIWPRFQAGFITLLQDSYTSRP